MSGSQKRLEITIRSILSYALLCGAIQITRVLSPLVHMTVSIRMGLNRCSLTRETREIYEHQLYHH